MRFETRGAGVFRNKQRRWEVKERGGDGRRGKGLREVMGPGGRGKQEVDKIEKRGGGREGRQQLSQIADISLGYITHKAPMSAYW